MEAETTGDSNNAELSLSIENLRNDLETLTIDLLKAKQELDGCLDRNLRSSEGQVRHETDVRENLKYTENVEEARYQQKTINSYNTMSEDIRQCLQQRIQSVVASLRFLNLTFNELKNFNQTVPSYSV